MSRKTQRRAKSAHRTGRKPPAPLIARDVPDSGPVVVAPSVPPLTDSEPRSRSVGNPPEMQASDQDQVEDELPPGVEYNLVLATPPSEIIPFMARIVSIVRGREDLPMTDEEWQSLLIEDDED